MTDELLSFRIMVASGTQAERELFSRAASASTVLVEIIEADAGDAAHKTVAAGIDIVLLDKELGGDIVGQVASAARAAPQPPFTVLLSGQDADGAFSTDALATKPANFDQAKLLMGKLMRVRLSSRVLVVDSSPAIRGIVRKILLATRFPLDVAEADRGSEAMQMASHTEFDIVFIDENLPGFSALEVMAELRRERPATAFVLITAANEKTAVEEARLHGAAFLKKPFYLADMEAVLCRFYGLRALNSQRA